MPESDLGFGHRVGAIVRIARTVVLERDWIADEVELAIGFAVHARIVRGVVVHVGDINVAEAATKFVRHGML
jgi:hypothetical protein